MVVSSDFEDTFENDITTRSPSSSNASPEQAAKATGFLSVAFYQKFFDVDTVVVTDRILSLMIPNRAAGAMDKINRKPDLYGPFWIVVTLIFMIAVSGNLADFLHHQGSHKWHYNFHLISYAATIIISYVILTPLAIWAALQWTPKHEQVLTSAADEEEQQDEEKSSTGLLALICSYGYSLAIYIPVSLLWTVQISVFQWILLISAATASGLALLMVLRPSFTKSKYGFALTVGVVALHILLAFGLMVYFFHDSSVAPVEVPKPSSNETG